VTLSNCARCCAAPAARALLGFALAVSCGGESSTDDGPGTVDGGPDVVAPADAGSVPDAPVAKPCDTIYELPAGSRELACIAGYTVPTQAIVSADFADVVTGSNGTLSDACDIDGNLVAAACEIVEDYEPVDDRQFTRIWRQTGAVISIPIDCGGRCVEGRCPSSCPNTGDAVRISKLTEDRVDLKSCKDGFAYDCAINPKPAWAAGCDAALQDGATAQIDQVSGVPSPELYACCGPLFDIRVTADGVQSCSLVDCRLTLPDPAP
jgi:hypothetical protein